MSTSGLNTGLNAGFNTGINTGFNTGLNAGLNAGLDTGLNQATWHQIAGLPASIANEHFEVALDPARGGGLTSIVELATGRELLKPGEVGNELRVSEEYPQHPEFGEGPWHLVPNGTVVGSAAAAATSVRAEESPLGRRYVVTGTVGDVEYEQRITLWHGLDRIDFRTRVLDFTGADRLLRVKFPCDVPGARPVSEVAGAVIGRGFALPDSDVAVAPWTLDNPANTFFALGSTATLRWATCADVELGRVAISVAEVVADDLDLHADAVRELVVALARDRRHRDHHDGGGRAVRLAARGLESAGHPDRDRRAGDQRADRRDPRSLGRFGAAGVRRLVKSRGRVCFFVPAEVPVEKAWVPNADLRDARALPVVIIAGEQPEETAQ